MRRSLMRRRLGELEQQLGAARAREAQLASDAMLADLRIAELEGDIRSAVTACDIALGQLHPLGQPAQHLANIRLALRPERLVRRG